MTKLYQVLCDESGQSLVEYAMILGLLVIVAIASIATLGNSIAPVFIRASGQVGS